MKWWKDTITVYHKSDKKWTSKIINNCFFGYEQRQMVSNGVLENTDTHIVRIPYTEGVSLAKGDIVAVGSIDEPIIDNTSGVNILKAHNSFIVKTVKINDKINPKHIHGGEQWIKTRY